MLQLVNGVVKVCVPIKGLSETKTYDAQMIKEEFGVEPGQWVDVKALKGDGSDNYPGVRGIGPKTAQDLIAKFGTLENVYKHLGELDKKVATKLAEGAESAGMGKQLAQIVTDVPTVKLDLEAAEIGKIDWVSGTKYMEEKLGFRTIVEKIRKQYLGEGSKAKREKKSDEQISLL
jgi:DNA polymerase-1